SVERGRCRALEDLDVLDVVWIEVHQAVRRRRALQLATQRLSADSRRRAGIDRIEVRRRVARVIDRNAVDDEQRLYASVQSAQAANDDRRTRARVTRRLVDD